MKKFKFYFTAEYHRDLTEKELAEVGVNMAYVAQQKFRLMEDVDNGRAIAISYEGGELVEDDQSN